MGDAQGFQIVMQCVSDDDGVRIDNLQQGRLGMTQRVLNCSKLFLRDAMDARACLGDRVHGRDKLVDKDAKRLGTINDGEAHQRVVLLHSGDGVRCFTHLAVQSDNLASTFNTTNKST